VEGGLPDEHWQREIGGLGNVETCDASTFSLVPVVLERCACDEAEFGPLAFFRCADELDVRGPSFMDPHVSQLFLAPFSSLSGNVVEDLLSCDVRRPFVDI